jgi:hypothetical protein
VVEMVDASLLGALLQVVDEALVVEVIGVGVAEQRMAASAPRAAAPSSAPSGSSRLVLRRCPS